MKKLVKESLFESSNLGSDYDPMEYDDSNRTLDAIEYLQEILDNEIDIDNISPRIARNKVRQLIDKNLPKILDTYMIDGWEFIYMYIESLDMLIEDGETGLALYTRDYLKSLMDAY